ncbi:MAG: hypothetical protein ACFUZC_07230 [Chthoniobacteraceae bacterium]
MFLAAVTTAYDSTSVLTSLGANSKTLFNTFSAVLVASVVLVLVISFVRRASDDSGEIKKASETQDPEDWFPTDEEIDQEWNHYYAENERDSDLGPVNGPFGPDEDDADDRRNYW